MLKERLAAANEVGSLLAQAERDIDVAIASIGALITKLPAAQTAAKLSPVAGNDAYAHLQAVVASMFSGRASMVAFHHEMDHVKTQIGLRNFKIVGTGDAAKILAPNQARNDGTETATGNTKAA